MRLGDLTWPEAAASSASPPIVLVPVGSTEQHGPHLPLGTDTLIAEEIAGRALLHAPGGASDGLVLGPSLTVTASGEHAGFPGTLSIGTKVMAQVVVELVRSATWAEGVVFVNGHGGNFEPVERAVELLRSEQHRVLSWWPKWPRRTDGGPPDLHAGRIETSLMLAIDPGLVRLELRPARPLGVDGRAARPRCARHESVGCPRGPLRCFGWARASG